MHLTDSVKAKIKECIEHFSLTKYFAKKAFLENQAIRNEFGEDDIAEKKTKQSELIKFMKTLSL